MGPRGYLLALISLERSNSSLQIFVEVLNPTVFLNFTHYPLFAQLKFRDSFSLNGTHLIFPPQGSLLETVPQPLIFCLPQSSDLLKFHLNLLTP